MTQDWEMATCMSEAVRFGWRDDSTLNNRNSGQSTGVQLLAPLLGNIQEFITPASKDLISSSALHRHTSHRQTGRQAER